MMQQQSFSDLVASARQNIKEVDVATVKQWQDTHESFKLVDLREDHEWLAGHLPQAIHLSKGVLEREIEGVIPDRDTKIVLYCGSGARCVIAMQNLLQMGYHNIYSLEGGLSAWQKAGYPIES